MESWERQCLRCGSLQRLATFTVPLAHEAKAGGPRVAMCFVCRAELHRYQDEAQLALFAPSQSSIRYRAVDFAVMFLTLALAVAVAIWARWLPPVMWWVVGVFAVVAVPAGFRFFHVTQRHVAGREEAFAASPVAAAAAAFLQELERRLGEFRTALAAEGKQVDEEGFASDGGLARSLMKPERWAKGQ